MKNEFSFVGFSRKRLCSAAFLRKGEKHSSCIHIFNFLKDGSGESSHFFINPEYSNLSKVDFKNKYSDL